MRRKVIAGNWKMNMLPNEAMEMISKLAPLVKETENEVVICAPYIELTCSSRYKYKNRSTKYAL